jgi:SAM-dependent methyltransferase
VSRPQTLTVTGAVRNGAIAVATLAGVRYAGFRRFYPEAQFGGFSRVDGTVAFLTRVHALTPPDGVVLDVGCGRGEGTEDLSAYRARLCDLRAPKRRVIGIDVDSAARDNPIVDEFRLMAIGAPWPVDSGTVDLAISRSVIEHVDDVPHFFSELARVLRPGGILAAHTTNVLSYPGIASRLMPNRLHARVISIAQPGREERDIFPTVYRCNTVWKLRAAIKTAGLDGVVYGIEAEPSYLQFSMIAYAAGVLAHRIIPSTFSSRLMVFARKPA